MLHNIWPIHTIDFNSIQRLKLFDKAVKSYTESVARLKFVLPLCFLHSLHKSLHELRRVASHDGENKRICAFAFINLLTGIFSLPQLKADRAQGDLMWS